MKKAILALCLLSVAGFALDVGLYTGPRGSLTLINMTAVHDELGASGYTLPAFNSYQLGFSFPFYVRLWQFTLGGGDFSAWQSSRGQDWNVLFNYDINSTELGYIIKLNKTMSLRPVIGFGSLKIGMRLSEKGGGFIPQPDTENVAYHYDYSTPLASAGLVFSCTWKVEQWVRMGFEAKALYQMPLEQNRDWTEHEGPRYVTVENFFPQTPVFSLGFIVGLEYFDKQKERASEE